MFIAGILVKRTINAKVYCFVCRRSLCEMYSSVQALFYSGNFIVLQALFYSGNFIVLPFAFNSSLHMCVISKARPGSF